MPFVQDAFWLGPFQCVSIDATRWNGWAVPRFTRAQAEHVLRTLFAEETHASEPDVGLKGRTGTDAGPAGWSVDEAGTIHVRFAQCDAEEPTEPDANGLYPLGGWAWTWSDADEPVPSKGA